MLQRKDILPGQIYFLPPKEEIEKSWMSHHLVEDGYFGHPVLMLCASEHPSAANGFLSH